MKEKNYYDVIKKELEKLFKDKEKGVYLEITADKFSNKIKEQIPDGRDIIFSFLGKKGARPDITGFIKRKNSKDFIVVEIKDKEINLDHIFQLKKYAILFGAKFAFLISIKEIPPEIKKLSKATIYLLWNNALPDLTLVHFDTDTNKFAEFFKEDPFEKESYWR